MLKIGGLQAQKGEKTQGYISVPGTGVEMPVTLICGEKEGKTALITGGTHGGEYPGIEAAIRLAKELTPQDVSGGIIIVHPVNVPAFYSKLQYFGPHDGKNLNREFPGLALGTVTQRMAHLISSQMFTAADLYMDLHGGDLHEDLVPFVIYSRLGNDRVNEASLAYSRAMGIKYVCGSVSDNGTFGCAAAMGVPGFLSEIGGCGLWCEGEVADYIKGVRSVLSAAGIIKGEVIEHPEVTLVERMVGAEAGFDGCWYPSIKKEEMVKAGQKIGELRDFFGNLLEEIFSPADGVCLFVVSSLSVVKGDPLAAIGKL